VTGMLGERAELALSHSWEPQLAADETFVLFPTEDALPSSAWRRACAA